jgi:hypothetical protein
MQIKTKMVYAKAHLISQTEITIYLYADCAVCGVPVKVDKKQVIDQWDNDANSEDLIICCSEKCSEEIKRAGDFVGGCISDQ